MRRTRNGAGRRATLRSLPARALLGIVLVGTTAGGRPAAAQDVAGTDQADCVPSAARWADSVTVGLEPSPDLGRTIAFGLPLPRGVLGDPADLAVRVGGAPVQATVSTLLRRYDAEGRPNGIAAVLVEIPAAYATEGTEVELAWQGGDAPTTRGTTYADVSHPSDETAQVTDRTIRTDGGRAVLVPRGTGQTTLFSARVPDVLATFPPGYLAATGILGCQVAAADVGPDLGGVRFVSDAALPFALSAQYVEPYPVQREAVYTLDPAATDDPSVGYEGWLYDRCATFLALWVHTGDPRLQQSAYRQCAYYSDRIGLDGERRGIFADKAEADPKYSHTRGLVAYYALTGDEAALAAGTAIADMWATDELFVAPYRAGHLRAPDHLWTERLLATSIEDLHDGHLLTGDPAYLDAVRDLVATAYRHITGDAAALAALNPGTPAFPPQDCFIHTAEQAAEGNADEPFCSGWMPALLVAPLLAYQAQTGDTRVDEILVRLTRYLRDTGTSYLDRDILHDTFLHPSVGYDPSDGPDRRILVPLYGAGIGVDGRRQDQGEYDDQQHCLDAMALVAAGMRALGRGTVPDAGPVGPFATEADSFRALFEELAICAQLVLEDQTRPRRDPATWTSEALADGVGDPAGFIEEQHIGWPVHNVLPRRKLSWWFNPGLEVFGLLRSAGIEMPAIEGGQVEP